MTSARTGAALYAGRVSVRNPATLPRTILVRRWNGAYVLEDRVAARSFSSPRSARSGGPLLGDTNSEPPLMAAVTYLEAIREALSEEMARDERVFLIGEDIGAFGGAFKAAFAAGR